jgi:TetR/AcrR family transcriptional repressor of nem operon
MREKLLDVAEQMVQDRGLAAVSFRSLAEAVGLCKAGVFHHFPNKESLTQALIDRCQTAYKAQQEEIIGRDIPAPAKLRAFGEAFAAGLYENRLCLLGALGNGSATLTDAARDEVRLAATETIGRFARVFEQGLREATLRDNGPPEDAAASFLALLQGMQVLARAKRDSELFSRVVESYIASIEA